MLNKLLFFIYKSVTFVVIYITRNMEIIIKTIQELPSQFLLVKTFVSLGFCRFMFFVLKPFYPLIGSQIKAYIKHVYQPLKETLANAKILVGVATVVPLSSTTKLIKNNFVAYIKAAVDFTQTSIALFNILGSPKVKASDKKFFPNEAAIEAFETATKEKLMGAFAQLAAKLVVPVYVLLNPVKKGVNVYIKSLKNLVKNSMMLIKSVGGFIPLFLTLFNNYSMVCLGFQFLSILGLSGFILRGQWNFVIHLFINRILNNYSFYQVIYISGSVISLIASTIYITTVNWLTILDISSIITSTLGFSELPFDNLSHVNKNKGLPSYKGYDLSLETEQSLELVCISLSEVFGIPADSIVSDCLDKPEGLSLFVKISIGITITTILYFVVRSYSS